MPSIVLCDPMKSLPPEPFDSALRSYGLQVTRTEDPDVAARLSDDGFDAVLLLSPEPCAGEVMALAARLCRQHGAPVVLAGGELSGGQLLEHFAVGVADHLPGPPQAGLAAARLLIAIERNETARELRRGYAAFRELFGDAAAPMLIVDPNGRLVDANGALLDLLGYTLGELRRLDFSALTHDDDAATPDLFGQLVAGKRDGYQVDKRLVCRDGSVVWVRLHASRLVAPISSAVHVIAELQNLTPAMETNRALDRMRNRYRALFEQVPLAILVLDLETMRFTEVNRAAELLFGYPRTELTDLGLADLWHGPRRSAREVESFLRDEPRVGPMRQRLRRKDGSQIETEVTLTPPQDGRRMLLIRNVTEVWQLELALDRSRHHLVHDRQPTSLLHDLANLLTVLLDRYEQLLQHLPPATDSGRRIDEVKRLGERVIELIRTFLASSRSTVPPTRPLDLGRAVLRAGDLIRALAGEGIEVEIEESDEPLPIWFDEDALDQILLNLATNARDAMGRRGRLTVSTGRSPAGDRHSGARARLSMRDTGPGVDPQLLDRIFEPYFTTKAASTGRGIGLATVERLVRGCGGQVEVENPPGGGAAFHVDLPLDAGQIGGTAASPQAVGGGGVTILLVDDDEAVCSLVRDMLESAGHRVLSADSGHRALRIAAHYPGTVDLLIVDATLDDPPSPELIARLHAERPEMRVLIVSGYLDGVLIARGLLGHDTPFLSKPFTAAELLARVDETVALAHG